MECSKRPKNGVKSAQEAAASFKRPIEVLSASSNAGINSAFASLVESRSQDRALLLAPQALFAIRMVQIATLAARHAVPAISFYRSFTEVGGLMSYGLKS
jgi:putative tryptophan/tyrosine transport system substrate-binding protein